MPQSPVWLFFDSFRLAFFTPLAVALQFPEREKLATIAAFAFNLANPRIFASAKASDVSGDNLTRCHDFDGALAFRVAQDCVARVFCRLSCVHILNSGQVKNCPHGKTFVSTTRAVWFEGFTTNGLRHLLSARLRAFSQHPYFNPYLG